MIKRKENNADHISTLLGMGTAIEGNLVFEDTIRVDGKVDGKIKSDKGTLVVGERAMINAEIQVATAIVNGTVNGNINASERIDAHAPAKITGDIQAPTISIETGVKFNGTCNMTKPMLQAVGPKSGGGKADQKKTG